MAGLGTQLFWGLIRVMIMEAFYLSSNSSQPMGIEDVITYIWLGQAFLGLQPWNVDPDLKTFIRSGGVSYELLRPLDLYANWYSRAIALRTAPTLLRSVPLLIAAGLFLGLQAPPTWSAAGAFALAMFGALLISATITTAMSITLLWTISGDGVVGIVSAAVMFFSGMIVPIPLFPDWAQPLLNTLPFRGLVDTPFRLYMGHIPSGDMLIHLAHQSVWILALVVLGRWVLSRGLRRLVVQGG